MLYEVRGHYEALQSFGRYNDASPRVWHRCWEMFMKLMRLLVLCVAVAVTTSEVEASNVSIVASKDNTIFANFASNSAGGAAGIFSGANNVPSARRGLIAFDIAGSVPA